MDIEVIREKTQESESGSVDYGSSICKESGAESVLVIPGDAPLITAEDVDFILEQEALSLDHTCTRKG
jgi:molybdopterin-guanine dinucleotide biosynthesis protein A